MIKARASGSKVYLYFMKKGRQARHCIPRDSCGKGQAGETPHSAEFLSDLALFCDSSIPVKTGEIYSSVEFLL